MASLLFFFISSSWATHYGSELKEKIEEDFKKGVNHSTRQMLKKRINANFFAGGQRNWIQVICNGGIAAYFAVIYYLETGSGEYPIDFHRNYRRSWITLAIVSKT